jgi:hypothetical protein
MYRQAVALMIGMILGSAILITAVWLTWPR